MVVLSEVIESENGNGTKKEEERNRDLLALQEWIVKQPHLPDMKDNERFFGRFLHTCNGSVEKTKSVIEVYFTLRAAIPELFDKRDTASPEIQEVFKLTDMVPLPFTTPEGYHVQLYRLCSTDASRAVIADWLKVFLMIADLRMAEEDDYMRTRKNTEVSGETKVDITSLPKGCRSRYDLPDGYSAGDIPLYDMKGFTLSHLSKIASPAMKKFMAYVQEGHPIKLRGIHVINAIPIMDRVLGILKPLMKNEMINMIHCHTPGSDTLYKYIPKEILPVDYGGNVESVATLKAKTLLSVESRRAWFAETQQLRADESKRQDSKSREYTTELFGMEGSFRKLSID